MENMREHINKFRDFLNEDKRTTQTIFKSDDKRIIRDKMDEILIDFDNKYDSRIKDTIKKELSNFIDNSMDDIYHTIIDILEKKKVG